MGRALRAPAAALGLASLLGWVVVAAALPARADDSTILVPDAPGPLDGLLADYKTPLAPTQREALVREALATSRWSALSRLAGRALLADTTSGYVDQLPWISRLRLAQAFAWMGTPERELARPFLERATRGAAAPSEEAVFGVEENRPRDGLLAARFKPETLAALLSNETLVNLVGETATLDDYQPGVWRVLAALQERNPGGVADFPALAVAMAVVYDMPFPAGWPHRQVKREKIPVAKEGWGDLFDWFVARQRERSLLTDLSALRADQLRFVVDIPLERTELDWVRENIHLSRAEFEKAFFQVRYDTARLEQGIFDWPGGNYRLGTIAGAGGICVDQAYFASMAGKARGLPTLLFVGEGDFGGHAWFGYLKDGDSWFLDGGRYANQNYVVGEARDPQTWKPINDHQLAFLSDPGDSLTLYHYSRNLLALSDLPGVRDDAAQRRRLLAAALQVNPKLPEIWEAVAESLKREEPGLDRDEALRRHYAAMADQFAAQDDLRVEALRAQAALAEAAGQGDERDGLWQQILAARSDLALQAASDALTGKVKAGDIAGAAAWYGKLVDQFAKRMRKEKVARGDLLHTLVVPYAAALDGAGRDDAAVEAVRLGADRFHFDEESGMVKKEASWMIATLERRQALREGKAAPDETSPN